MNANLEKKRILCEKAEALKESTDWKATADELTKLQKEWKTVGPVAKKYSDTNLETIYLCLRLFLRTKEQGYFFSTFC